MPVKPRGKAWQADVNHKGRRFRIDFSTEGEARAWEAESKKRLKQGLMPFGYEDTTTGAHITLAQLYKQTYERFWHGARGEKALSHNGRAVRDIIGPDRPVARIGEADISRLVVALKKHGNSNATINRKLAALSKMLRYGQRLGYLDRVPPIDKTKEPEGRFLWWDNELEANVLEAFHRLGRNEMVDFCALATDTGCRVGEMLRIERDHIVQSDSRPLLMVWQSKSGKARSIPLTSRAFSILNRRVVANQRAFPELTQNRVSRFWGQMLTALETEVAVRVGTPHTMRHTFCSRLVQRGVDLATVKQLAGHSSIVVTMRYAHLSKRSMETAIEALETNPISTLFPVSQGSA